MLILWTTVFIISLAVLVKSADWLLDSAQKLGYALGFSPFVVGALIVGFGTSLPELASSIAAVLKGAHEIVVANAVGSNIANILLVIGVSAIIAKQLTIEKNLIDLELPLLAFSTTLFLAVAWGGEVTFFESILLISAYIIYLLYTLLHKEGPRNGATNKIQSAQKISSKDIALLILGLAGLIIGSKYLIESVINLSNALNIGTAVITVIAVALGTSLPELLVSIKAALANKPDLALGNIFGSNAFNILMVVGIPGLFGTLPVQGAIYTFGLPALATVTLLFIFSGISRKIYNWEGAMFLLLYVFFVGKMLGVL